LKTLNPNDANNPLPSHVRSFNPANAKGGTVTVKVYSLLQKK